MATLQELIDRATDIAAGSIDGPMQDASMLAQSLLPEIFHDLAARAAADPYLRTVYRRTLSVAITAGVGNLPDEAFTAYACAADVLDANGDYASWLRYDNFVRTPDIRLAHFALKQGTELHYSPVGGGSYTGNISVTIPCAPVLPATATATVVVPDEVLDDIIRELANRMVASYKAVR